MALCRISKNERPSKKERKNTKHDKVTVCLGFKHFLFCAGSATIVDSSGEHESSKYDYLNRGSLLNQQLVSKSVDDRARLCEDGKMTSSRDIVHSVCSGSVSR